MSLIFLYLHKRHFSVLSNDIISKIVATVKVKLVSEISAIIYKKNPEKIKAKYYLSVELDM